MCVRGEPKTNNNDFCDVSRKDGGSRQEPNVDFWFVERLFSSIRSASRVAKDSYEIPASRAQPSLSYCFTEKGAINVTFSNEKDTKRRMEKRNKSPEQRITFINSMLLCGELPSSSYITQFCMHE